MLKQTLIALRVAWVTLAITGLLYPLIVTGLAQGIFPSQANGSLVKDERGQVVGSGLLGQAFPHPAYFQPRPSAAGQDYEGTTSGGSNLGPTSRTLRDRMAREMDRLRRENPDAPGPVPAELVMASASGLDPHLSPAAALWQVPRVARARHLAPERVRHVVEEQIEERDLAILGEPRVNVLQLNLSLDRHFGKPYS